MISQARNSSSEACTAIDGGHSRKGLCNAVEPLKNTELRGKQDRYLEDMLLDHSIKLGPISLCQCVFSIVGYKLVA
jgi:hypothetical protein